MKRIILILILLMNIAFAMQEELHTYLHKHLNNTSIQNISMSVLDGVFKEHIDNANKGLDYITANTSDPLAVDEDVSNVNFLGKVKALANTVNIAYASIDKNESFKTPVAQEFKDEHYGTEWTSMAETKYVTSRVNDGLADYLLDNPAESWEDLYKKERYFKELRRDKRIVEEKDLIANIILAIPIFLFDIDILILLVLLYFFRKDIITSIKRYPLSSIFLATIYPIIKINVLNPTLVPNTNVLIISGIISFIIFLNIIYSLNRNKYRLLGFYTSLESMFSSSIDKKIEYLNEKMIGIINSTPKSNMLYSSKDLDIKQKQLNPLNK